MMSLPLGFSLLPQRPRRGLLRPVLTASAALLLGAGLLIPATTVRAQTEVSESVVTTPDPLGNQPTAEEIEAKGTPTFVISNIYVRLPAEHSTAAAGIPTTSKKGYEGTVNYTCELISESKVTSTPAECAMYPASAKLLVNASVQPQILIFGKGTKLPAGATMTSDAKAGRMGLGALGVVLGGCLLFGIPARRRQWRALVSGLLLLFAVGGMSACADNYQQITSGTYVFKITGTDSEKPSITSWGYAKVSVL